MQPETLTRFAFATGTAVALLLLQHAVNRLFAKEHTLSRDVRGKNVAYLLVQAGHVLAVLFLVPGIVREALLAESLGQRILWAGAFSLAGTALIQIVGTLGVRLLLGGTLQHELDRGNVAAGVAGGANYVAVGILAAPAIAGSDLKGLGLSIVFFSLAVLTLAVFVALFRALTTYDDAEQIQGDNLAAALSYAGVTLAVSILLARALKGDFEGWASSLAGFGWVSAGALALYPVRQVIVHGLILGRAPAIRGGALDTFIGTERNVGMAVMEALTYLATAVAIAQLT